MKRILLLLAALCAAESHAQSTVVEDSIDMYDLQQIEVVSTRARTTTPVAYTDITREEIERLGQVNLRTTAVVAADRAEKSTPNPMSRDICDPARIELTEYRPNYLRYEYTAPEEAVAVFSEIFYDKGWTAYVDGKETPCFRADYVLRAMELPAGEHVVEWRFRAPGWSAVETVTGVCSALILLGTLAAILFALRKKKTSCHEG